jgi:DNA (cytosine-5)-methyltransferase 1
VNAGPADPSLRTAALFAGIGGIELGLQKAGHTTEFLCEWDEGAQRVLRHRFPGVRVSGDIAQVEEIPECDLVAAGFPCQDLSQAGRTAGIGGERSGLIGHVFRLLDSARSKPTWLLLENVSFMLSLDKGEAMRWLTHQLETRGYTWAYRVVDSRAFGLPQRRQRVLLLASRSEDPRPILLNQDHGEVDVTDPAGLACGFYWTEGTRGLGWAVDAIPTLKGGSGLGIPSPPAIWHAGTSEIVTPALRDAERFQGFDPDWTIAADALEGGRRTGRWKLVGNAVSVPVAKWLGKRLTTAERFEVGEYGRLEDGARWPRAAWGRLGERHAVDVSMWPVAYPRPHLHDFLLHESKPLSARATTGFLGRAARSNLRIPEELICELETHLERMLSPAALATAAT